MQAKLELSQPYSAWDIPSLDVFWVPTMWICLNGVSSKLKLFVINAMRPTTLIPGGILRITRTSDFLPLHPIPTEAASCTTSSTWMLLCGLPTMPLYLTRIRKTFFLQNQLNGPLFQLAFVCAVGAITRSNSTSLETQSFGGRQLCLYLQLQPLLLYTLFVCIDRSEILHLVSLKGFF